MVLKSPNVSGRNLFEIAEHKTHSDYADEGVAENENDCDSEIDLDHCNLSDSMYLCLCTCCGLWVADGFVVCAVYSKTSYDLNNINSKHGYS